MKNDVLRLTRIGAHYLSDVENLRELPTVDTLLDVLSIMLVKRTWTKEPAIFIDPEIEAVKEILRRVTITEEAEATARLFRK